MRLLPVTVTSLLAGITIGYICGSRHIRESRTIDRSGNRGTVRIATITHRETLRICVPQPAIPAEKEICYIPIPASRINTETSDSDTIMIRRETRIYADSTFRAVVSGADPRLDSLTIYPPVSIVKTVTTRRLPRWGLGITAGAVATRHGLQPGISVGITYRIYP